MALGGYGTGYYGQGYYGVDDDIPIELAETRGAVCIVEIQVAAVSTDSPYFTLGSDALGTGVLGPDGGEWLDISEHVVELSTAAGRSSELDPVDVGKATLVLDNADGQVDPLFSPLQAYLRAGNPIRIRGEVAGEDFPIWFGTIEDVDFELGYSPTVTLSCVDLLAALGGAELAELPAAQYESDLPGARLARVLDVVGFDLSRAELAAGSAVLASTVWGEAALATAQKIAMTEDGLLFPSAYGTLVFYGRDALLTRPRSVTAQAYFSDLPGVAKIEYEALRATYSLRTVWNDWTVKIPSGVEVNQYDQASIDRNRRRSQSRETYHLDDSGATGLAARLVRYFKDLTLRFESISTNVAGQPDQAALILGLTMWDMAHVARHYVAGTVSQQAVVQGISHRVTRDSWTCEFNLTTVPTPAEMFRLGSGRLDVNALG
ncbi:hypothetical protein [Parafrankia sp. EUN1f]|uniref:hypothetical protein n=1 Tax=Parafrankia sp. EUN1f TaxID=102897 RepID=UPI0001C45580|nr:hypothetical protein [Parafrankia sp. EUN1f]EFC86471.1 hypothetical protein FrEUN1fDRAFT_0366 [Parafrankia sp. EUN1f]